MQIHGAQRQVETNLPNETKEFSIKNSAQAFSILSSNLYQDKPTAVIRELCCNALDAHTDAGNLDTPFEVFMPNDLRSELRIKDYGVGLSDDQVMNLYTTYFDSTKGGDNNRVGGLGLGSKSPFSYVDTFTVTSRYNGVKSFYTAFINDTGTPAITKLSSSETDEPNGVEVTIPVRPNDFRAFTDAAYKTLQWFEHPPKTHGITITPIEYTLKTTYIGVAKSSSFRSPKVLMGPVAYDLDPSSLSEETRENLSILPSNYVLFMDIGDVSIAASREALSYDRKSLEKLNSHVNNAVSEFLREAQEEVDLIPTYIEAVKKRYSIDHSIRNKLTWKGESLNRIDDFEITSGECSGGVSFAKIGSSDNFWCNKKPVAGFSASAHFRFYFDNFEIKVVIVPEDAEKVAQTIQYNRDELRSSNLYLIRGNTDTAVYFLKLYGITNFIDFDDLEKPPAPVKASRSYSAPVELKRLIGRQIHTTTRSYGDIVNQKNIYLPLNGTRVDLPGYVGYWLYKARDARNADLFKGDVICIPRAHKKLEKLLPGRRLDEFLKEEAGSFHRKYKTDILNYNRKRLLNPLTASSGWRTATGTVRKHVAKHPNSPLRFILELQALPINEQLTARAEVLEVSLEQELKPNDYYATKLRECEAYAKVIKVINQQIDYSDISEYLNLVEEKQNALRKN